MESFPTDYILFGPCLKNLLCIIQFFHVIFQLQGFNYFLHKLYDLVEEIMEGNIV